MDTIKVIDELLPGFQEFLFELQNFELTSELHEKLSLYLKRLDSYITDSADELDQDSHPLKLPHLPPPPLPVSTPEKTTVEKDDLDQDSNQPKLPPLPPPPLPVSAPEKTTVEKDDVLSEDEIAAQRTLSWQYSNISSSGSKSDHSPFIEADEVYETPLSEHEALQTKCSMSLPISDQEEYEVPNNTVPIRMIDDEGEVYDEPDNVEEERVIDDVDLYEDPEDDHPGNQTATNGVWSDASGSYESFDSDEYVDEQQKTSVPSLPQKDAPAQTRNNKAEQFKIRCENDPYIIHYGILSIRGYSGTLSRISLGKWSRKYCIVHKGLLSIYNKPSDKTASKSLTLFGYDITEEGQDGKNEYVFGIHHQGQTTQYFATTSKDKLETWVKVLKEESTNADNIPSDTQLIPQNPLLEVTDISLKDKIKFPNMLKRRSKAAPMLFTEDSDGNLAGIVNVLSPVHGEQKWKERFCLVTNQLLHVYKDASAEKLIFTQPLEGMEIGQGKQTKRKNTLTLCQGDTTYVSIEAVNNVDHGKLLCKLIKETGYAESMESDYITPAEQIDTPTVRKKPSIFTLMQRFEASTELDESMKSDGHDSLYLEIEESTEEAKPETPSITLEESEEPVYENNSTRAAWLKSKLQPKRSPNTARKDVKEKEKKEKKKKKKKDKEKEKDVEDNSEIVVDNSSSQQDQPSSPEAVATTIEEVSQTKVKEKVSDAPKIENKFVKSDKKHLLDVDRLQGERKLLLEKREDLRIKKIELRGKRNACEDETQKAKIEKELNEAIQEWTSSSKELTELEEQISKLSKGDEVSKHQSANRNSSTGRASPMLQRAISSNNVMARAKMFEAMGKE